MKTNPKAFFSFAKSRQKTKAKIGPFIDPATKQPNHSPDFTASQLSEQYSSVFVKPRQEWTVNDPTTFFSVADGAENTLSDINFTEEDIEKACSELKHNSAVGADGIPAVLLKCYRKQLSRPLFILWRRSIDSGSIPVDLLMVMISPVHKGGSRGLPSRYRPVALTSHIVKIFERVIRRALVMHLEEQGLLPDGQHGFRACRSTLTQLLSFWDSILDQLAEGKEVHAVYLDFAKAFDKVETGVLLHGLRECRVLGKVACWVASFLDPSSRQQAVVVDGRMSDLTPVISGVPQGTVLGPVLFLIHIRNIASRISSGTSATSFADDTRVARGVETAGDCSILQADLQEIYNWALRVNMEFNADKFECLKFKTSQVSQLNFQYVAPDSTAIEEKDNLRDLGVQISTDLTFNLHIETIVASAARLAGWGLRSFRRRGKSTMKTILKTLIQPKLDYCSQLFSPTNQESINRIESVQRNFTSHIDGMQTLDYWSRLQQLCLFSQERRREIYMIIFLWKISQGRVAGYNVNFCTSDRRGLYAVPQPVPRSAPANIRRAREASLGVRGAKLFNQLPIHIRNSNVTTIESFKSILDQYLANIPDQPTVSGLTRAAETNSLLHQIPLMERVLNN